jgi:hypothetical protein
LGGRVESSAAPRRGRERDAPWLSTRYVAATYRSVSVRDDPHRSRAILRALHSSATAGAVGDRGRNQEHGDIGRESGARRCRDRQGA